MFGGPFIADGSTPPQPGTPSGSTSYLDSLSQSTGISLTGGFQQSSTDPFVYMGAKNIGRNTNATVAENTLGTMLATGGSAHASKLSDLQRQFIDQDEAKKRHWAFLLGLTGYAGASVAADAKKAAEFAKTASLQDVLAMHEKFLEDAADQFNVYKRKITPMQMMKEMLRYRLGDKWDGKLATLDANTANSLLLGGDGSLAGSHTQTSRSVDLMSPEDAKGLVRATLQQQLGRDPTQAEYEDFISAVHAAERANPTISKTTYTTDSEGNTTNSNTTTRGGLSESGLNQLAYEKARSNPDWGVWQAVGTYAPALFAALDAPVSGV